MSAYDLAMKMKSLWADNCDKRSGHIDKVDNEIAVLVNTIDGYREVIGIRMNKEINAIELILDRD
jgi:transposase-like protein